MTDTMTIGNTMIQTTGDLLFSLNAEGVRFHDLSFSPDGSRLVVCSESNTKGARVWDLATQEELFSLELSHCTSVDYSPDGSRIACGALNRYVLFDASTGKSIDSGPISRSIKANYHVTSVAFSPDGRHVVGACSTNAIRLWELP